MSTPPIFPDSFRKSTNSSAICFQLSGSDATGKLRTQILPVLRELFDSKLHLASNTILIFAGYGSFGHRD